MLCRVATAKPLPILYHSVDYIYASSAIIWVHSGYLGCVCVVCVCGGGWGGGLGLQIALNSMLQRMSDKLDIRLHKHHFTFVVFVQKRSNYENICK